MAKPGKGYPSMVSKATRYRSIQGKQEPLRGPRVGSGCCACWALASDRGKIDRGQGWEQDSKEAVTLLQGGELGQRW